MTDAGPPVSGSGKVAELSPDAVKRALRGDDELALVDVREPGEYAAGHPLFAVSIPFSRFEPELLRLAPNLGARIVLLDGGDDADLATRAAQAASRLGYRRLAILAGGAAGWRAAGYELFDGENVPSKVFGELLHEAARVPSVPVESFEVRRRGGEKILLLDGRPFEEHRKMCVPGSISLPNGDLAYRIGLALDDETTPVVVHCAGRTRSILGAQTLRELGLKNPVAALEDGTQGWRLAGLDLEHGSVRRIDAVPNEATQAAQRRKAAELAQRWGVPRPVAKDVAAWAREAGRTAYLLDVRSPAEFAVRPAAPIQNAPGGQLVQATDRWLAVRGARVVLVDDTEIRAVVTAHWLRQMGWDAMALAGGSDGWPALAGLDAPRFESRSVPTISAATLAACGRAVSILDLRSSAAYREAHVEGARWATRGSLAGRKDMPGETVLVADDPAVAALAAADLAELDVACQRLDGTPADWRAAGLPVVATPADPPDRDRVDFVAFMHDRHAGNAAASHGYLAWEKGLVDRLAADERAVFRIVSARH